MYVRYDTSYDTSIIVFYPPESDSLDFIFLENFLVVLYCSFDRLFGSQGSISYCYHASSTALYQLKLK